MPAPIPMGLNFGLQNSSQRFKRKFRWIFAIDDRGKATVAAPMLPPIKSSRPNINFKEFNVQHLTETIYFPGKPDWKPIPLSLYDLKCNENQVFKWIKSIYVPSEGKTGEWRPSLEKSSFGHFKRTGYLTLFDGCGFALEEWVFENIWPQQINFGELEMGNSDVVTVDLMLRYDRAYEREPARKTLESDQGCKDSC